MPEATGWCQRHKPVRPGVKPIHLAQHRLREKEFFRTLGIDTAPYQAIRSEADIAAATALPGILKTCTEGYDGKGQVRVADRDALAAAWAALGRRECILEALVDYACETSAIVARGLDGQTRCFPTGLNDHRDGILRATTVPSAWRCDLATIERYGADWRAASNSWGWWRGAVRHQGRPCARQRDGAQAAQFRSEDRCLRHQPVRAAGARHLRPAAGTGRRPRPRAWKNLIGSEADDWLRYLADPTARLHLYGKATARPGARWATSPS